MTYTDSTGVQWLPDQVYVSGSNTWGSTGSGQVYTTSEPITGTADSTLYQSELWWAGNGGYRFAVPNGQYSVTLKFAEIYPFASAGARVFSVRLEGTTVAWELDLAKTVGKYRAYDVMTTTVVSDGVLNLDFIRETGNPQVNAIRVYRIGACSPTPTLTPTMTSTPSPTPTPTVGTLPVSLHLGVNAGGPAFTDSSGQLWQADQAYTPGGWGYVGGEVYTTSASIASTSDATVYQTERWWSGTGTYKFTVLNGTYDVRLKLAEIYPYARRSSRVFDIMVEGTPVRSGVDIYVQAGLNTPYDITAPNVVVSDGVLQIDLLSRDGPPMVNAILVTR